MNFFKIFFITHILIYSQASVADQHESVEEQTTEQVEEQTIEQSPSEQATLPEDEEDEVPLNDPFAGNESGSSMSNIPDGEEENEMSLYKFKLVGVMAAENDTGFVSLINASGEIITLSLFEDLSPGVKLVGLNNREAVFEKNGGSLLVINFKNQIIERTR